MRPKLVETDFVFGIAMTPPRSRKAKPPSTGTAVSGTEASGSWCLEQREHFQWIHSNVEPALDPEIPIVDAHHHLWHNHDTRREVGTFMLTELTREIELSGHHIRATVYMQSGSAGWRVRRRAGVAPEIGETEVAQGIASQSESGRYGPVFVCAGIIASIDPSRFDLGQSELGSLVSIASVLDQHAAVSRNFRGIRICGGKAEHIPFKSAGFTALMTELQERGLVWDCNGPETHPLDIDTVLGGICETAARFDQLTIVVDHCGGAVGPAFFGATETGAADPDESGSPMARWKRWIARLASHRNVYMKVGGLQMTVNGYGLARSNPGRGNKPIGSVELTDLTADVYSFCIETFGPERCMFESNFPVDLYGVGYGVLWNSFKRIAAKLGLTPDQKRAIFHDTAATVYRLCI